MDIIEVLAANGFSFQDTFDELGLTLPELLQALGDEPNKSNFALVQSRMSVLAKALIFKKILEGEGEYAKFYLKEYKEVDSISQVFIEVPYVRQDIQRVLPAEGD